LQDKILKSARYSQHADKEPANANSIARRSLSESASFDTIEDIDLTGPAL